MSWWPFRKKGPVQVQSQYHRYKWIFVTQWLCCQELGINFKADSAACTPDKQYYIIYFDFIEVGRLSVAHNEIVGVQV